METGEAFQLGIIPEAAIVLTAGVDVQGNWIEVDIYAWAPRPCRLEPWTVNSHVTNGNQTLDKPWDKLDTFVRTPIRHASGAYQTISVAAIDSGDDNYTKEIYEFCRLRHRRWINGSTQHMMAIKGLWKPRNPIIAGQPIERRDILRYGLFGAIFLGLDHWTEERWERERGNLPQADLFPGPADAPQTQSKPTPGYYVRS